MACTVDSDRVSILATVGSSTKICFMATSQSLCPFFGSLRIESFARTTPVAPEPVTAAIATYPFPEMPLAALSLTEFSDSTTGVTLASATVIARRFLPPCRQHRTRSELPDLSGQTKDPPLPFIDPARVLAVADDA
jgi:hypothetical protein